MLNRIVSSAVVALIPPLTLLTYYGILARYFFPYGQSGVFVQTQLVQEVSEAATVAAEPIQAIAANHASTHPLIRVIDSFLSPILPLNVSPRWLVYAVLIALGCWLWRRSRTRRLAAMRLLAGVMIFSSFSAMTGIFELPAWQGRNVFIALYTGVAAVLWTCIDYFPKATRRVLHSPPLLFLVVLCVAGPAIFFPPVIGKNVPIANVIQTRNLPSDNQVLAELIRTPDTLAGKRRLAVIPPINDASQSHLISNLLRLHYPHPREHAFPGYQIITTNNPLEAFELDALLIPTPMLALYPLPEEFVIHTTGRNYVFAIRRPSTAP